MEQSQDVVSRLFDTFAVEMAQDMEQARSFASYGVLNQPGSYQGHPYEGLIDYEHKLNEEERDYRRWRRTQEQAQEQRYQQWQQERAREREPRYEWMR